MNAARPIGVFDSGVGGLTVLRALRALLPNESFIYLGDTARVPYGNKSAATIQQYAHEDAAFLLQHNVKAIVVACNTASAHALPQLAQQVDVPVLGMIAPGARAALAATKNRCIGIMGTRATVRSAAYEHAMCTIDKGVRIIARDCPLLVPLAEEMWVEGEIPQAIVRRYLRPMLDEGVDTIILGCTHYPLLKATIQAVCGSSCRLVDSAVAAAQELARVLQDQQLLSTHASGGQCAVYATDDITHTAPIVRTLLGDLPVEQVAIAGSITE